MSKNITSQIESEMINRAITDQGITTFYLSDGEKTTFYSGIHSQNIPKKLLATDPSFYKKLYDEIFDELHPY
jgi:hypothetical protein